jgi:predicted DNA-binding transcriptional regulator
MLIIILSMTEEEMIRQIAEPILEQLKKIEKQLGNQRMSQIPQVKFVKESEMLDGPFMIGDIEVTDELLEKVEAYIQEEIEMMHEPTVLH